MAKYSEEIHDLMVDREMMRLELQSAYLSDQERKEIEKEYLEVRLRINKLTEV